MIAPARDDFAVICMSGYTEAAALENGKIGSDAILLNKPFSTELPAQRISELQHYAPWENPRRAWREGHRVGSWWSQGDVGLSGRLT